MHYHSFIMRAAERLLAHLRTFSPSDVPSDMQLSLAEQLRDLAYELELQARWTALPLSPTPNNGEDHYQEDWDTTEPSSDPAEFLPSTTVDGNTPIIDDNESSASWETMNAEGVSLPSAPCPCRDLDDPATSSSQQFRPPNPYEEYAMGVIEPDEGELETNYGFDNPRSGSSGISQFSQRPGPDRQIGLFVAKHRHSEFLRTPSPAPSSHSSQAPSIVESDHDLSIPLPPPRKKAAWWEKNIPEDEGSSPFESLTSRNPLSTDLSFSHDSEFIEGGTEVFTSGNISEEEHNNEEYTSIEPSGFLIDGTELVGLKDPFWNKTPMKYPILDDPDESTHNQLSEPVNRSHKLLLDIQAVRRDINSEPELSPPLPTQPSVTLDMMPVVEAAGMPLPPSPLRAADEKVGKKGRALYKPSMWNRLANGVLNVVGRKKQEPKDKCRVTHGKGSKTGRTLRSKKSFESLFGIIPGSKDH